MIDPTLEYVMEAEHIFKAMRKSENGVRWKASVQRFEIDTLRWAATLNNEVCSGKYKSRGFRKFDIMERGKLRHIQSVHISERTVQKLLCNYALKPTIYPTLIYDNSASQEGKGTEFALTRLKEHLRWHLARYGKKGVVVVMDYHDFFASIPHEGAIKAMSGKLSDDRLTHYVEEFVNAFDGDFGLGLGSETSQIGAICYPSDIDRFIKEELRVHCYARYMDDSYMILPNREYAEYCLKRIKEKVQAKGMEINDKKTVIHNMTSDDFVFLKKRIHIADTGKIIMRLTRKNFKEEKQRIRHQRAEYDAGRLPLYSIIQSYNSWRGYAKKYNSYHTVGKMDDFFESVMGDILQKGGLTA